MNRIEPNRTERIAIEGSIKSVLHAKGRSDILRDLRALSTPDLSNNRVSDFTSRYMYLYVRACTCTVDQEIWLLGVLFRSQHSLL